MDGQPVRTTRSGQLMQSTDNLIFLNDLTLARTAERDRPTAEKMLRRIQPKIFQVIRAAVRTNEEALDIGQAVVLTVMEKLRNYRGDGSLEAWAGGIAYNVTMRSLRNTREWDRKHVVMRDDGRTNVENPESQVSRRQLFSYLESKMNRIPTKRKTPLFLHLMYGYTVDEISTIMNTSPNTTKFRLKTALRELREILEKNPSLKEAMLEVIR